MTFVEEEFETHPLRIVFAARKTMVLGKNNMLGVVTGKMFGHVKRIIGRQLRDLGFSLVTGACPGRSRSVFARPSAL